MMKRTQKQFSSKPESLEFNSLPVVNDFHADAHRRRWQLFLFGTGVAFILGLMIGRLV